MKKFLHIAILSLIPLCFSGCWGWGWFVPYSFQPSYHEFKKMCKLNELPNNEEKYNKILSYFDTSLDTLDWKELNKRINKMDQNNGWYKQGKLEYITNNDWTTQGRIEMTSWFFSDESEFNKNNIQANFFSVVWHTRRYLLDGNESSGIYLSEETLGCSDILELNMTPKGAI